MSNPTNPVKNRWRKTERSLIVPKMCTRYSFVTPKIIRRGCWWCEAENVVNEDVIEKLLSSLDSRHEPQ